MDEKLKCIVTIYGVYTYDDEFNGSFKAYCATKELASEELKNFADWYNDHPEPDDRHIVPLKLIVEPETKFEVGCGCINRFTMGFGHHD